MQFNFDYHITIINVLWALGWAMIVLSALVYLPAWVVTTFGVVMIATHNLLDSMTPPTHSGPYSVANIIFRTLTTLSSWPTLIPRVGSPRQATASGIYMAGHQRDAERFSFVLASASPSASSFSAQ